MQLEVGYQQFIAGDVVLQSGALFIARMHFVQHFTGSGYIAFHDTSKIGVFVYIEVETGELKADIVTLEIIGIA